MHIDFFLLTYILRADNSSSRITCLKTVGVCWSVHWRRSILVITVWTVERCYGIRWLRGDDDDDDDDDNTMRNLSDALEGQWIYRLTKILLDPTRSLDFVMVLKVFWHEWYLSARNSKSFIYSNTAWLKTKKITLPNLWILATNTFYSQYMYMYNESWSHTVSDSDTDLWPVPKSLTSDPWPGYPVSTLA